MLDRQEPSPSRPDPPAGETAARHGDRPGAGEGRDDDAPPRSFAINQHSFADEDFEVDTARNYHGVDDPA